MDYRYVSRDVMFFLEGKGKNVLVFEKPPKGKKPENLAEQIQKKVLGVRIAYGHYGDQTFGIDKMAQDFGAYPDGLITRVPKSLEIRVRDDIIIMKYGDTITHPEIFKMARAAGVVGYWDSGNIIICASKEFEPLIMSTREFIQPKKARFAFGTAGISGPNLMVVSVK